MRNQPSYLVSDPALDAIAAATTAQGFCESRNQSVAQRSAASDAAKSSPVIGVDCRYKTFGFSAKMETAAIAKIFGGRAAKKKNPPAETKQSREGTPPANPVRHRASRMTNGIMTRCGSGSHTVP